jgi:hypothetical protein
MLFTNRVAEGAAGAYAYMMHNRFLIMGILLYKEY